MSMQWAAVQKNWNGGGPPTPLKGNAWEEAHLLWTELRATKNELQQRSDLGRVAVGYWEQRSGSLRCGREAVRPQQLFSD